MDRKKGPVVRPSLWDGEQEGSLEAPLGVNRSSPLWSQRKSLSSLAIEREHVTSATDSSTVCGVGFLSDFIANKSFFSTLWFIIIVVVGFLEGFLEMCTKTTIFL